MDEQLPTLICRDSEAARAARPLVSQARVLKARVVAELRGVDQQLEELHQQGQQIVEEARQEAEEIRSQAAEEGRREGLRECMEALGKARAEYGILCDRAESDMVKLAFQVARRIIGHAIEANPEIVRDIVGEALVSARGRQKISVRVNPEDFATVQANRDEYARQMEGIPVYFEKDSTLERGDCVIDTESGRIDARLHTQLEVLEQALLTDIEHPRTPIDPEQL